jgi:hypothetical protein
MMRVFHEPSRKKKKNSMNKSWGSVSSVEEITRSPIEDERDENEA